MMIGQRSFVPRWWSVLLTMAGVALCVSLGLWQLERAAYKESIELKFEQRLGEPYQSFSAQQDFGDIEYRKLKLRGRFDNARNLLVDNQLHQGRAGYYVLTPLLLDDSDRIILVNRGWTPWGDSRSETALISPPANDDGVTGIAFFPSEPALRLGEFELTNQWPQLIQHIDIDALQAQFSDRLIPFVLWLAPEHEGYYVREWNPVWMRPEKSQAYAVQWFAFAMLALVFFIILNLRKIE
jgi:surfeit locus 1 family protein